MKVSSLTIEMAANVARLQKDMDDARRVVEGTMGRISDSVSSATKVLGFLGVGAGVSGLLNMARDVSYTAQEFERLSQLANTTAETMQGWSYGARTVGVQQEKLSDILKDVNDKVGEFLQTGSGPMKDFFENIAPKVGVTAEQFARLGGPEALQLYTTSLQKAGVGQKEATFYMEALASDATALLPLLKDNGKAMNNLASEAQDMGLVMSDQAVAQAVELARQSQVLDAQLTGVKNTIATAVMPTMVEMARQMASLYGQSQSFAGVLGGELQDALRGVYSTTVGVVTVFQTAGQVIGGVIAYMTTSVSALVDVAGKIIDGDLKGAWNAANRGAAAAGEVMSAVAQDVSTSWATAGGMINDIWRDTNTSASAAAKAWGTAGGKVRQDAAASKEAARAAAAEAKAQQALYASLMGVSADYVEQLGRIQAMRLSGMVTDEQSIELATRLIEQQKVAGGIMEANAKWASSSAKANADAYDSQLGRVHGLQDELDAQLKANEAIGLSGVALAELEAARQRDAAAELERRSVVFDTAGNGAMAQLYRDQAKAMRELADARVAGATKQVAVEAAKKAEEAWKTTTDQISQGLTDALMRGFEDGKSFGQNFVDSLENMFKTQLAKALQQSIAQGLSSLFGGQGFGSGGGGGMLDLVSKAWGFFGGGSSAGAGVISNGMSQAAMLAAQEAGMTAGATAGASAGTAASAVPVVGWIASAVMVADSLYKRGYTRATLTGAGQASSADRYASIGNSMRPNESLVYKTSLEGLNYKIMEATGVSGKWTEIFTGSVRMAHLFGQRLKEYGYQVQIASGEVQDATEYAFYKGGLFRGNKTRTQASDSPGANAWETAVRDMKSSSATLAVALGGSREAVDNYTGTVKVNLRGVTNAAEEQQRYSEALQDAQRQMINAATGADYSAERFASMMADINQSMSDVGISAQGISDILVDGIMGRMSEADVGAALSDMIIGGIYESIASSYAGQIASVFTGQILTPMFAAMAAGVPISQAISQQAIANVVATAQSAAAALNAIFNDAGFRQAIAGIETAISGVAGAVTRVKVPSFGSTRLSATNAAAQKANEIARERFGLETQLLSLLGNTAKLRERELNALSAGNRALQQHIWAIEDARDGMDRTMDALRRAVEAEQDALDKRLSAARDTESMLNDVFGTLRDHVRELRGQVADVSTMQARQALDLVRQMRAGTADLDADKLRDAVSVIRTDLDGQVYASRVDRDRAYLTMANELAALQSVVQPKLSDAERTVLLLEEQIEYLNTQLQVAEDQMNALLGIDTSVKSVASAVLDLNAAMATYSAAIAAGQAVTVASSAPAASTGGSGGYKAPTVSSAQWTASGYLSKNPDLKSYWAANGADLARDRGWTIEDYALWHWEEYGKDEKRRFATGGAFAGGVVRRPTFFDMGQMAERGTEAIMPLANVGGYLGVRAHTGGDSETRALLQAILRRLDEDHAVHESVAVNTSRAAAILRKVSRPGGAIAVQAPAEQPVQVQVAP
ncbi:MAG: hypothetical protein M0Q87_06390 [Ottowia sp.]|nr:hypothetical protein [Ottowia sp.]